MTYPPSPSLSWISLPRTLKADELIAFLSSLALADSLTVVVLDNASMHRSKLVKGARPELLKHGIVLYFLPPYSPESNLIEPVFGVINHYDMPERSYTSIDDLTEALDAAFQRANQRASLKT
jgi:transposase